MKIIAIISAYNEEDKIALTVSNSKKFVDMVIVVDDCSGDGTYDQAKEAGADAILRHEVNQGQGASIREGLKMAYQEGADIAITIDGDFQHDPSEIPLLIEKAREYDVVLGSRFKKNKKAMPIDRLIFNILMSFVFKVLFSFKAVDSQTGFRAFNRNAMKKLILTINRYDWTCEMADQIVKNGLKYTEVPITIRYFNKPHQADFMDGVKMYLGIMRYYFRKN